VNGEAGTLDYLYSSARPQTVASANGVSYTYDLCGNMTLRGSQRLDYDARNRLANVSANTTTTATFGYADSGERLWKQSSAGLHVWIGALYEVRNGVPRFHIMADGKRIAAIEPGTGTTHYQHGDHLGSASILSSDVGTETKHYEYSPFGRERFASSPGFMVSHRFTGQVLDEETGLYYYNARYYDPNLARFIQADTLIPDLINPQALNRYAYTLNNPLKYVDPSGHWPQWSYEWMPNWMVRTLTDGTDSYTPTPGVGNGAPISNMAMLRDDLGDYDDSQMKAGAQVLRAGMEANPVVGLFNSGYTAATGKDAVDPTRTVGRSERIQATTGTAAAGLPFLRIGREAAGDGFKLVRYGSREEATASQEVGRLLPRPGHERQPKWIGLEGTIDPRSLGKRANSSSHTHKMDIYTNKDVIKWLNKNAKTKENEPGRWGIPADKLDEFNSMIETIESSSR
jgi:RHS repeat-associated protein